MEREIEFFDSNVLIASMISRHDHHIASIVRLASLPKVSCAAHSLSETYNTLTRHKSGYSVPAADAASLIEEASVTFTLVSLTPKESVETIKAAARLGVTGPMIFDALLIACARKIQADHIYTWNVQHFRKIAPDLASRILQP